MAKQPALEMDGEIMEILPAAKFKVMLKPADVVITCYKSGKMKQSHISVIPGDWVKVEVNQYDMNQGRIVYRYNEFQKKQIQQGAIDQVQEEHTDIAA